MSDLCLGSANEDVFREFQLFDPRGFIERLDAKIDEEFSIGIGMPRITGATPGTIGTFFDKLRHRELAKRVVVGIELGHEYTIFDLLPRRDIGYIDISKFYDTEDDDYPGYEFLRFKLRRPLRLKDGRVIPPCKIKVYQAIGEWEIESETRRDHQRKFGIYTSADLRDYLPSNMFAR